MASFSEARLSVVGLLTIWQKVSRFGSTKHDKWHDQFLTALQSRLAGNSSRESLVAKSNASKEKGT